MHTHFSRFLSHRARACERHVRWSLVPAFVVALGTSCGANQMGPCEVVYQDALLGIARVTDATIAATLPQVTIRDVQFRGTPVPDLRALTATGAPARGVTVTGGELRCDVACSFGSEEGVYTFTVSRAGYRDTTVTVDARYANREGASGGCPLILSGGERLTLQLTPE